MTIEFSAAYLDRCPLAQAYMRKYAKRNGIGVTENEQPVMGRLKLFVQFTAKSRHQMLIFASNVCQRFEFFEFW